MKTFLSSFSRFVLRRIFATALITALVAPVILLNPTQKVSAQSKKSNPAQQLAPPSAPPEPFVITAGDSSAPFIAASILSLSNILSTPQPPEGLEMAKVQTFGSKLTSYLGSFFGLFTGPSAKAALEPAPPPPPPAGPVDFDFDNDNISDRGRWHPATQEFKVKKSGDSAYSTYTLGTSADAKATPGDYDGDGDTDACVFNDDTGVWTYKTSTGGSAQTVTWGTGGDIPVAGKYDTDAKTDFAIYRPSTGYWWILKSSDSSYYGVALGNSTDIPVVGDYDGDGKSDPAVFRPSNGYWYIQGSSAGYYSFHWGIAVDVPVPADYDGDGKTDPAVFRPTTGDWYAYKSGPNDGSYLSATWGNYGDQPVPGYYNSDDKADFAVWRPTTGMWYTMHNLASPTYDYQVLGVPGDQAVPSAYIKQIGSTVSANDLNAARLSPKNATGGTDLYSQNFGWSSGLVGLPGRSGLNAGFGMGYNSLIWIRQGNSMVFDPDTSNISPGFRFGFPVIEPVYYDDDDKDTFAYMMVTPSGGRVEFRQTAVSNTYETADSSYTQLVTTGASSPNDPVEDITIKVTTTDGTQMSYIWKAGAFRCTQIKDRNGNYTSNTYDDYGALTTVTDTLGRVITVNYDGGGYPTSITQTWKDSNGTGSNVTHNWATFTYTTIQITTDFDGLTVFGPPNGTYVKVLQKVTRTDGSHTDFFYNAYGQIWKVSNIAADSTSHVLNYVRTNLESPAADQTDCPRFTKTFSAVENFQSGGEIEIRNENSTDTYSLPGSISGSATKIQVWMVGHPDNLRTNTFVGSSGWKEGLPIATEDCLTTSSTCSDRKRWGWTGWTQDNTSLSYPLNPRVIESQIGDGTNTKRSTTEYYEITDTDIAIWGLPKETIVYKTDLTNIEKKIAYEYNLDTKYTNRRIIGLPYSTHVYGYGQENSSLNLVEKMTYAFDGSDFSDSGLSQNISPVQHDNTNYSSSFNDRGNLTSTTRWDVSYPNTSGYAVTSSRKYNTAGSVVSKTDPLLRTVKISYADVWNDSVTRTTYAYPTTLTDPANNSSTIKYRYDIGANVEATSPAPAGNTYGKKTKRIYDDKGRIERDSVYINTTEHSYVRYDYQTNGIQSKVYAPIIDADGDGNLAEDEVLSESWSDGAGRVLRSRAPHPGSTGGWKASLTEYDILGRTKKTSVPTEISVSGSTWTPAGDDSTRGWIWNEQEFDWKGRVKRIIPSDSTGSDGKDQLFSYDGCGCAGGQVTTIQSESVPVPGETYSARRVQKVTADILGRDFKTEVFNWDGTTPYTTTVNTYNGRDQITNTRQYSGSTSSGTYQDVVMAYDGHGRMKTRHYPIENSDAETSWNYNADDSISQVIDPRLAITDFTYNSRGLVTQIAYTPPSGYPPAESPAYMEIPDTPTVGFTYDNLGNRTEMTDGLGSVSYEYDPLSRLAAETRYFTDDLDNAPVYNSQQAFRIEYVYNLSGGLKTVTDPYGADFDYTHDSTGQLIKVEGSAFGDNTTGDYIEDIKYRAFGAIKQMTYNTDDEAEVKLQYDNRLRVGQYEVDTDVVSLGYMKKSDFEYYNDSKPKAMADHVDDKFDRTFEYDHMGRLTKNHIGPTNYNPYDQTIQYDNFSQMTNRAISYWQDTNSFTSTFSNGRESTTGVTGTAYDPAGNQINTGTRSSMGQTRTYDAANRNTVFTSQYKIRTGIYTYVTKTKYALQDFDGDGRNIKTREKINNTIDPTRTKYQIWSTALGGYLTEANYTGAKEKTNVYAGGAIIAEQWNIYTSPFVAWIHADPVTGSTVRVSKDGTLWDRTENEPHGQEINPYGGDGDFPEPQEQFGGILNDGYDPQWQCDGDRAMGREEREMPVQCQIASMQRGIEFYITYEEKGNPDKVAESAARHERGHSQPSVADGVLAHAKKATNKNATAPRYDGAVPSTSVPSADGTVPDCGVRDCSVNVSAGIDMSEIVGMRDASVGGGEAGENYDEDLCDMALDTALKDRNGLRRANEHMDRIRATGIDTSLVPLMAAIGIVETNFENIPQIGGGPGRGVYQIEPASYGISEADAKDFDKASMAVAKVLDENFSDISSAYRRQYPQDTKMDNQFMLVAGLARTHNRWREGVVSDDSKGVPSIGPRLADALKSGSLDRLNEGTSGGRGGYVTKVMSIYWYCF